MTLILAVLVGLIFAATSFAGIDGSAHDLASGTGLAGQICSYCHTPHNANIGGTELYPLWSMDTLTVATYTNYTSSTLDATLLVADDPLAGPSRLCMSCHDGTVAMDSAFNTGGAVMVGTLDAMLGTDLTNDHPIGFNYDTVQALPHEELWVSTTSYADATIADYLHAGTTMTCASCHDVHTPDPNDTAAITGSFLLIGNANSALCLSCHNK